MAILILPSQSLVLNAYAVLIGSTPGNAAFKDHQAFITANGVTAYKAALEEYASSVMTNAQLATALLTNLGLGTSFSQAQAEAFLTANPGNRVGAMTDLAAALYGYSGTDAKLLASKAAYVTAIEGSFNFSNNIANVNGQALTAAVVDGQTYALTVLVDNLVGSAFNDAFVARTLNNANTFNDGDKIDGGAGTDTVYVDFTSLGNAITPVLKNIETVVVRAQTTTLDVTNGNNQTANTVQIDAQRSLAVDLLDHVTADVGVTRWESNNSRSDVIIEDVRIGNTQKTKDVTIAMVETDPGNVDFGVYFDQFSLRNASSSSSTINIQLMDTGAAAGYNGADTSKPLLNNPYDTFKFLLNGVQVAINLNPAGSTTVAKSAETYAQLLAAFQAALTGTGVTASLGADFTITDPLTNKAVTGKSIVLVGNSAVIGTDALSGWYNTLQEPVPADANIYNKFGNSATSVSELVTSTVVLDDVGRGSTGGDLVVGGMSIGQTSTSRGVERFEITVNDNSKLQTINSTNNALREVTIVNGLTSKTVGDAYTATVKNEGDLTVNGTNFAGVVASSAAITAIDANLAGVNNYNRAGVNVATAVNHSGSGAAGFTDVRLIDASDFKGKLAFTAAISSDSIPKYVTAVDTAANPAADVAGTGNVNFNVPGANFIYTGGNDNDTMAVTIDATVASSRSTIVSGLSDFTFKFSGGEGNDAITTTIVNTALAGGAQAWYTNQKLNANITINGGAGNDTIRTPGAGDVIITGDAGNDTIYTDNTGALAASAQATGSATAGAIAYSNAAAAELASEQAAWIRSNAMGSSNSSGTTALARTSVANKVIALKVLDDLTPTNNTVLPAITHAALAAATATAVASGAITFDQKIAIDLAYGAISAAGTVTPAATIETAATYAGATAVGGNVTQTELTAGDAVVAGIMATLRADVAANAAATTNEAYQVALLNATQLAVVNANKAINQVYEPIDGWAAGSAVKLAGLQALQAALVNGTTAANVVAAINTAIDKGAITTGAQANSIVTAAGAGAMDATEAAAVLAILSPLVNTANNTNNTNLATLAAAQTADQTAVNNAAAAAALDAVNAVAVGGGSVTAPNDVFDANVANDSVGNAEANTAAVAAGATAGNALARANADVAAAQAINTAWTTLKAAVNVGALAADLTNAIANANAAGVAAAAASAANGTGAVTDTISGVTAALAALAASATVAPGLTAADELTFDTGALGIFNAASVDAQIIANNVLLDRLTVVAADKAAVAAATAAASTIALAAANSGTAALTIASPKAVFVFDTSGQNAPYVRQTMDERNLADLKSDTNETWNFFNSTVKVTYKGLDASVVVAGTGYKTTDLEINQAIKAAINLDPILSKLLVATDGPANSLVVTSLIDGTHVLTNLAVTVTMPTAVTAADLAGATTAGLVAAGSTDAQLLTAMGAAKAQFDSEGDYVTQWAESGAAGSNLNLVGANGLASSDNTVTPGTDDDVIVLGTTVGTDLLTSSNETVVYSGSFGKDTIVYFAVSGNGIDKLDFSALNGRGSAFGSLSADKSIVVGAPVATAETAAAIALKFTDSATAINHVYVAVDTNNIGSIWQVADAAGTAAGNVTATLVGSIDLADTAWGTLTAANFI